MVAFALGALLAQGSMFSTIFPAPTGTNGYEEYVRAADYVASADFDSYENWLRKLRNPGIFDSPLEPPAGIDLNDSDLTVRRKWNDRYRLCCNLVSSGNHKQVYEPRDTILPETTFPEMASFRDLARLEANAAHVAFADGQTGEAIVHIEDAIVFGGKIASSILISRIVGLGCESITFFELDDHWAQLSVNDAHELRAFFGARANGPPLLVETIKSEKKATRAALESCVTRPGDQLGVYREVDTASSVLTAIQKISAADAQSTLADAEADADKYLDSVIGVLNGPESGWLTFKEPPEADAKAPLSGRLADMVRSSLSQLMLLEVRSRTRMRLAYLTASAIEFRWITGRLPEKIERFTSKEERLDPSSGKNFVYKRDGSWFHITRENKDALGSVALTNPPHTPDPDLIPRRP